MEGTMYSNNRPGKDNGRTAKVVRYDDRGKTVILQYLDDGKNVGPISVSTLKRWWKKSENQEEQVKEKTTQKKSAHEAANAIARDFEEALDQEVASDGTTYSEVMQEIIEDGKKAKKNISGKDKTDNKLAFSLICDVLTKAGYYVKQYEKEPKIIPVSVRPDCKNAFCSVYVGSKKCVLCMRLSDIPDTIKPDRVRKCPLGAAFDISYDSLSDIITIINKRVKKEEK